MLKVNQQNPVFMIKKDNNKKSNENKSIKEEDENTAREKINKK